MSDILRNEWDIDLWVISHIIFFLCKIGELLSGKVFEKSKKN